MKTIKTPGIKKEKKNNIKMSKFIENTAHAVTIICQSV